jgi:hypothetical protein
MIMLFEARGFVFLGESVLQHEIFKEFACEAKDRPQKIELLEKINRMYENVTFTDIVSCDVIDNDKQATTEIVVYPLN